MEGVSAVASLRERERKKRIKEEDEKATKNDESRACLPMYGEGVVVVVVVK